jgi:triacylglycerol lipase
MAGDRLWVRGRLVTPPALTNGHTDRKVWWKRWRKNGDPPPPPAHFETTISGQVLTAELPIQDDGHFEGLLRAQLPLARRGWRLARNRLQVNGYSAHACNIVLGARDCPHAAVVVLPFSATWPEGGARNLAATADARVMARLHELQRANDRRVPVYYLAVVPANSDMRRPDLAIAIAEAGWPTGHLLILPAEQPQPATALAAAVDRLRWLFFGVHDLWLLHLDHTDTGPNPNWPAPGQDDRAPINDLRAAPGAETVLHEERRNGSRPTRAALLPRFPVVFCHGMLGYSMLKWHRPQDINYFSVLRHYLDPRGIQVLFPRVGPTSGVAERAEQLRDQVTRWTKEPVNLVAHSMGGLDARYMITHLGMADQVRSLTTIATPHHGSYMADWFQTNFRRQVPLLLALEALGINVDGFSDCRPGACREFNAATPDAPHIHYFSYGGDVPPARLTPFLRRAWGLLTAVEGPNDGLVSIQSSRWGEFLGAIQADHFAQTPDGVFVRDKEDFDAVGFYIRLVEDLARRGF